MRTGLFTNAAIASVLVVPAITLQGGAPASLEASLERTLISLETLTGIGHGVESGQRDAVGALIASTEAALPNPRVRDELLSSLRVDVSALERELDGLHGPASAQDSLVPSSISSAGLPPVAPTHGMDEATRRLLAQPTRIRPLATSSAPTTGTGAASADTARTEPKKRKFEAAGYTADALALARAYYRKGEWMDALALLQGRDTVPAETYWRARCLEKLERNTEAVAAYEKVMAHPDGGWEAQRAREDLDFLRWRMKFSRVKDRKAPEEKRP